LKLWLYDIKRKVKETQQSGVLRRQGMAGFQDKELTDMMQILNAFYFRIFILGNLYSTIVVLAGLYSCATEEKVLQTRLRDHRTTHRLECQRG
jgi:hypothetical protein